MATKVEAVRGDITKEDDFDYGRDGQGLKVLRVPMK